MVSVKNFCKESKMERVQVIHILFLCIICVSIIYIGCIPPPTDEIHGFAYGTLSHKFKYRTNELSFSVDQTFPAVEGSFLFQDEIITIIDKATQKEIKGWTVPNGGFFFANLEPNTTYCLNTLTKEKFSH
jgi:hypothetical protein